MTPSSVVVRYGDAFKVDCNSTTDQLEGMGWESTYKGTGLIPASHVQLNIEKADRWSIHSQCFINLLDDTQCSENLPITVYKNPDVVSIRHHRTYQAMEEHKEYEFYCEVVNVAPVKKVNVTWYKNDRSVQMDNISTKPDDTPENGTSRFLLKPQNSDNGGKLRCEVKFDFGPSAPYLQPISSLPIDLHVFYQPFFKESKVEMSADQEIRLDCTAQGNPTPQYRWQVPQPSQLKMESEPIVILKRPFPGTYNCTASNSQGSSIKQFVITDAPRDYTVLAAVIGVVAALGVLLLISGPFIVTKDGTFSCSNGSYSKGQPSQPI